MKIVFTDSGSSCTGVNLGEVIPAASAGDTGGTWVTPHGWFEAPVGVGALDVKYVFDAGSSADFEAYVDSAFLYEMLFGNGFESGDTQGWSNSVP